jgi:hypothetical protein
MSDRTLLHDSIGRQKRQKELNAQLARQADALQDVAKALAGLAEVAAAALSIVRDTLQPVAAERTKDNDA